ncbi:MAG TPA: DeoR/GlpR family DNA-binding transcription regulator [Pseudonocardia sp.]
MIRYPPPEAGLTARQRRQRIIDQILRNGSVDNDNLVRDFRVSQMTIYRDLDLLEDLGWLRKVRGGATATPSALFESNVKFRERDNPEAKLAIARHAVEFIDPGQAIFLDDSTTALALASLLPSRGPLTVITNFLSTINALSAEASIKIIALGGTYYPSYNAFLGLTTSDASRQYKADAVYLSTSAITDGVCYHQSQEAIMVKRALMAAAHQKILMVDHSKFHHQALHELAPLSAFDRIIVDSGIDPEQLTALREIGVPVDIAPDGPPGQPDPA